MACAIGVAVMGLLLLVASLADVHTRAAPLDGQGTGSDPRIETATVTSNLPISDTHPGDGVTKTVYFSNSAGGAVTATFEISGTPTLTFTAGAAFDEPERVYTSPVAPASFAVTYTVAATHTTQSNVEYTATNATGDQVVVAISYVRDVTGPAASIASPPAGYFTGTQLVVAGTAADDGGSGVWRIQVMTGTAWETAVGAADWAYTTTVPSADGVTYTLSARGEDFLGTAGATATRVITVDNVAPTAAAPVDAGTWSPTSTLVFTWATSSDAAGISGYYVVITDSNSTTVVDDEWVTTTAYTLTGATEGVTYFAKIKARDGNGNVGSYGPASDGITPDLSPPVVNYGTPPIAVFGDGLYAVGATVYYTNAGFSDIYFSVRGTAADGLSGEGAVQATPALGTLSPGNSSTWSNWVVWYTVSGGSTASGQITVTVTDAVDNAATRVFTYTYDPIAPTGAITIAGGADYVTDTDITLTLFATDNLTGCGVAQMCVGDSAVCSSWESYTTTRPMTLMGEDGDKAVYVRYQDHLRNTSVVYSSTIFLDTAKPVVTVTAPAETTATTFTVSWEAVDPSPGSGLVVSYTVDYREDDGIWESWLSSITPTESTFPSVTLDMEHTYAFSVTVYDRAGNRGEGVAVTRVEQHRVYLPVAMSNWVWWYQFDVYEPNDTPSQAYGLTSTGVYTAYIWDATDREDYYYFTPSAATAVQITLANIPAGADYDLYVYYYDGAHYQLVARSNKTGNQSEGVTFVPVAGRKYYIRVYPYSGSSNSQPYRLTLTYQ
jgi:hypothetical protein